MTAPLCKDCAHYLQGRRRAAGLFGPSWVNDPQLSMCKRTDHVDGSGQSGRFCGLERSTPGVIGGCDTAGRHFKARDA
jgi:hypothetical protein